MMRNQYRLSDVRFLTGIDLKTLNTLIRRGFVTHTEKVPLGVRKHEHFISFNQILWVLIFRLCVQGFHLRYDQFAKAWKDNILDAIENQKKFFAISRHVDEMDFAFQVTGSYEEIIDKGIIKFGLVTMVFNLGKMRESLIKKIVKLNGEK